MTEEISCPVCLETFKNPYVLTKCLHTLCLHCIQSIEENGVVCCPECRKNTNITDIQKDFKTKRLIALNKVLQIPKNHLIGVKTCGMCKNEKKAVSSYCSDCSKFICQSCEKLHLTDEELHMHTLQSVLKTLQDYETRTEDTIEQLQKDIDALEERIEHVSTNISDVQIANAKQVTEVNKHTEDIIKDAKENEKRLTKIINDTNNGILKSLSEREVLLKENRNYIQSKIDLLRDQMRSRDIMISEESLRDVIGNIKKQVRKMKSSMQSMELYRSSPLNISRKPNWTVVGAISLKNTSQNVQSLYANLWIKSFKKNTSIDLKYNPRKLLHANNQLWCIDPDGYMYIYDKKCKLLNTIKHKQVNLGRSLTVTETGQIIVACDGGLHECFSSGGYYSKISKGVFCDVAAYHGDLYALEYTAEFYRLLVFRKKDDEWNVMRQYKLLNLTVNFWDRLRVCVNARGIYISSCFSHNIYVYNSQGEFQHQIGAQGSNVGELRFPLLCGIDEACNIFVADCQNHRLQMCDTTGDWHVLDTPIVSLPVDAVMVNAGEMWLIQHGPKSLVKLTK